MTERIKAWLAGVADDSEEYECFCLIAQAITDVCDLEPPEINPGDDPTTHALLNDGWSTCHATVLTAIATALGVDTDG